MAKFSLLFAKSLFFKPRPYTNRPTDVNSGTVILAKLGREPFAISCQHVLATSFLKPCSDHHKHIDPDARSVATRPACDQPAPTRADVWLQQLQRITLSNDWLCLPRTAVGVKINVMRIFPGGLKRSSEVSARVLTAQPGSSQQRRSQQCYKRFKSSLDQCLGT